jgi:hypothetical protein
LRKELETDKFKNLGCDFWWKKARREREFLYSKEEPQMTKPVSELTKDWSQERLDHVRAMRERISAKGDRIQKCLNELDEAGATGLDWSPGDPVAREAAAIIRLLLEDGLKVE